MTENGCEGNPACWEVGVTDCAVEDDIHDEAFTAVCNFTGWYNPSGQLTV